MRPSLKLAAIVSLHFCIRSLVCVVFNWFLMVSDASAAVIVIVRFSRCFLVFLLSVLGPVDFLFPVFFKNSTDFLQH